MEESILLEKKNILIREKNVLESVVLQEKKKFFHLKTVNNLIEHYTEIKSESDQEWVFKTLQEYINSSLDHVETIDRSSGHSLYDDYLSKVTSYYGRYLNFSYVLDVWLVIALYIVFFFVLLIFMKFTIAITICILLSLLNVKYLLPKYKQKRTFGIFH